MLVPATIAPGLPLRTGATLTYRINGAARPAPRLEEKKNTN